MLPHLDILRLEVIHLRRYADTNIGIIDKNGFTVGVILHAPQLVCTTARSDDIPEVAARSVLRFRPLRYPLTWTIGRQASWRGERIFAGSNFLARAEYARNHFWRQSPPSIDSGSRKATLLLTLSVRRRGSPSCSLQ